MLVYQRVPNSIDPSWVIIDPVNPPTSSRDKKTSIASPRNSWPHFLLHCFYLCIGHPRLGSVAWYTVIEALLKTYQLMVQKSQTTIWYVWNCFPTKCGGAYNNTTKVGWWNCENKQTKTWKSTTLFRMMMKPLLEKWCQKSVKIPTVHHETSGNGGLSFELRSYHQKHPKTIHGFAGHFAVYGFCSTVFWWKLKYVLLRWCCWSLSALQGICMNICFFDFMFVPCSCIRNEKHIQIEWIFTVLAFLSWNSVKMSIHGKKGFCSPPKTLWRKNHAGGSAPVEINPSRFNITNPMTV